MFKNRLIPLLAMLIIPVIGFFLLKTGINHYARLHFFGPKKLSGAFHFEKRNKVPDTIFHSISSFKFKDQDGASFGTKQLDGNPYVGNLFFSRCPDVCLRMNANLDSLQRVFKVHPEVKFVSITVDPAFDSVAVLKSYSEKLKADPKRWKFLTGNKDSIYQLARKGFLLDAFKDKDDPNDFIHSQMLVLVDGNRHIRGYYDGTQQTEWKRLIDELVVLRLEQMRDTIKKGD